MSKEPKTDLERITDLELSVQKLETVVKELVRRQKEDSPQLFEAVKALSQKIENLSKFFPKT